MMIAIDIILFFHVMQILHLSRIYMMTLFSVALFFSHEKTLHNTCLYVYTFMDREKVNEGDTTVIFFIFSYFQFAWMFSWSMRIAFLPTAIQNICKDIVNLPTVKFCYLATLYWNLLFLCKLNLRNK